MLKVWREEEPGTGPGRVLQRWVHLVQSYPKATLGVCMGVAVLSILYSLFSLDFKTSRTDLVHPSQASAQDWKRYASQFGEESDIIVVVAGADQPTIIAALKTIARDVSAYPQLFEKLCYRIDAERLRAKGLYQLDLAQLQEIRKRLETFSPLLVGAWDWMSVDNVLRATRFRIASISLEDPLDQESYLALENSVRLVESLESFISDGRVYRSPWQSLLKQRASELSEQTPEYFFSPDGKMAILRVAPIRDATEFAGLREPIAVIRQIADRVQAAFPSVQVGLTGLPVLEDDEMQLAKSASGKSMMISVVGVALLFVVAFRAWKHPIYAMTTLGVSACWTMGWVTLTVGHLSVLSVSFIVTLIGLGIDYSILWISRYESDRARGIGEPEANLTTACAIGPGIVVGAATTALAFFTTMTTELLGMREMGWIAGSGVLFCLLGTFTVLPAMLALEKKGERKVQRGTRDAQPMAPWLYRRAVAVVCVFAVALGWLATSVGKVYFDYNLLNLQPRGLASVEWEDRLIRETGTSGWYALSIANSAEEARRMRDGFEQLDMVGRVVEIASLIPADQPEKYPIVQKIHELASKAPSVENAPVLPQPKIENLSQQLDELARTSLPSEPGNRILVRRLANSAAKARDTLASLSATELKRRVAEYERLWLNDLLEQLNRVKEVSGPEPVTVDDLPVALRERFYNSQGKWLLQVFAKESIWDLPPLLHFYEQVSSVDAHATGKPISTMHALLQMTNGLKRSAMLALLVIVAAVWFDTRSLKLTVLALIPLVVGVVAMVGLMGWFNIPVNPANMIAFPLILGIGVDFGVHVVHDYRAGNRPYTLPWRLGRALSMTSLTTIIGFSSLLIARHYGMMSIGLVLTIGVSACTICALFLLPALLYLTTRGEFVDSTGDCRDPLGSTATYIPRESEAA